MDQLSASPASKILGSKGQKLRAHEVHIRRTAEKGKFIAKHILRDKEGNPPTDGQWGEKEYALANSQELMNHLSSHLGDDEQAETTPDNEANE